MKSTTDRATALRLLQVEHDAVYELIEELADEEMTRPNTIRYGLYSDQRLSFKDLLAHLTTYEAYTVESIEEWLKGRKNPIIDTLASDEGSVQIHYGGIESRRELSLAEMLREWDSNQSKLMQVINDLSDEAWSSPAPYQTDEPTDLGGMVEEILVQPPRPLYRHLPVHIPDAAAYIRSLR
ncbi:MAG: DinB family protein [Burkholderiales bacterium]|nr:DinB family protein [Anaerolineae bacterium]